MPKQYWLMKSEPDVFSFEDLKRCANGTEPWDGIRNYQARNFMRDQMKQGDQVLFYHSNAGNETGVVGIATIASKEAYPDVSAFDPSSKYYDEKSDRANPRWMLVDVRYKRAFKRLVSLQELKANPALEDMLVIKRGQRLSIQPVDEQHFEEVCRMGGI